MLSSKTFVPPDKAPTLVHVARLAGVGIGTASRVLNREGYVSEATAARVKTVIAQLGYKPNEIARNLKVRRSGAIGIVVPDLSDPFIATCVQSAQAVIRESGNTCILTFSQGSAEIEAREIDYLTRRQVDGILIMPAGGDAEHLSEQSLRGIPLVSFDKPIPGRQVDTMLVRNREGAIAGMQHLVGHGHRAITFLAPEDHTYTMTQRIEGYREVMEKAGLTPDIVVAASTLQGLEDAVSGWLARETPPTAVFSGNGLTSICLLKALAKFGVDVPRGIAVVGFDDLQLADLLASPLTVVRQPASRLAAEAAERLLMRTRAGNRKSEPDTDLPEGISVSLETELILRQSCGCPA